METKRCRIQVLNQDDYEDVKRVYFDNRVRKFLGGIVSIERYNDNFKWRIYWICFRNINCSNSILFLKTIGKAKYYNCNYSDKRFCHCWNCLQLITSKKSC